MEFLTKFSSIIITATAIIISGCNSIQSRTDQPLADQRNLIPEVRIDQDKINRNEVPFNDLYYAGKHIFSNRFTSEDYYGEGPGRSKIR